MKKPAAINLNLLPKDPFLSSPIGRVLTWALSVGRYLVIFTELVVIVSFATRFSLDRQVTDLNGSIHQKQIIIDSYGELEQNVRDAQKKIDSYLQVQQTVNISDAFGAISQVTPQDIKLSTLTVLPNTITFTGSSPSSVSLNLLINNLQFSPNFTNVVVDRIQTKSDQTPGFTFTIHASIQRDKNGNLVSK